MTTYDESGNIGKRYRRADAIGVPFCITIDDETLNNGTVTVRDRDTMEQVTIKVEEIVDYVNERIKFNQSQKSRNTLFLFVNIYFSNHIYKLGSDNLGKEDFKRFVRSNPNLIDYVNRKEHTWQDFYEMYDIYGENSSIWDKYREVGDTASISNMSKTTVGDTSLKDLFNMIKKIDLESVRKGAEGLQKAITLVQDFTKPNNINTYQARPLYQHFED